MRGPARSLVLVLAALSVASAASPATAEDERPGPCAIARGEGEIVAGWVKELIRCAEARWEVPGGAEKAICIADAESGLDPKTSSEDGAYLGLFQHSAAAWPDRYRTWTRPAWELDERALNARTNTIVTMRMVNASGWGPWKGLGDC